MDFSYKKYSELLKYLKNKQYVFKFFNETNNDKCVYLRHDVDLDVYGAVPLAKIEKEEGVKSIYYFLPTSSVYNMLDSNVINIINIISSLGHQIGLHIDASNYESKEEILYNLNKMQEFYSQYMNLENNFSFHKPSPYILEDNPPFEEYINPYEKRFYKDISYVSDSGRRQFLYDNRFINAINDNKSIQLLTHPIWWKDNNYETNELIDLWANFYLENNIYSEIKKLKKIKKYGETNNV